MLCRTPRDLPSLGALMEEEPFLKLSSRYGKSLLKSALQEVLAHSRERLLKGDSVNLTDLSQVVEQLLLPSQRRVLNLTGTILHTNLGRAPLGDLLHSVASRMEGYTALEFDLEKGKRGKRGEAVERLLRWITGVEAALLVNNCSAAMILLLTALAKDREVIVSRGELVEIGGGFRIPDILATSGARLVEVGTTNRTRLADYEKAISEQTALLLSTHRSNFEIVGFTESPTQDELLKLGQKHGLPVVFDLGSGMLTTVVEKEPSVGDSVAFSLTAFSGDKLLGGPQCGILMGHRDLVEKCRKHPLYRAFRCDKITLALMEEVLRRHATEPVTIPTVQLLSAEIESLKTRAETVLSQIDLPSSLEAELVETVALVGGGSLPGGTLPSIAIKLTPSDSNSLQGLQSKFREAEPPIIVRLEKGSAYLDFRSLAPGHDQELLQTCRKIFT